MNRFAGTGALLSSVVAAGLMLSACGSSRMSEPLRGPLAGASAEVLNGQEVFMKNCNKCHPLGESGLGPSLNNRGYLPSFMIRYQVRHGMGVMPSFSKGRIPSGDLDDLIDYLKALRSK
jgi:mono/diheme cytochrome c family protein